jgi:hypothetical protein
VSRIHHPPFRPHSRITVLLLMNATTTEKRFVLTSTVVPHSSSHGTHPPALARSGTEHLQLTVPAVVMTVKTERGFRILKNRVSFLHYAAYWNWMDLPSNSAAENEKESTREAGRRCTGERRFPRVTSRNSRIGRS